MGEASLFNRLLSDAVGDEAMTDPNLYPHDLFTPSLSLHSDSPQDWGLPLNHTSWRTGSFEAIQWALNSPHRHLVLQAPTGSGKSGIATALSAGLYRRNKERRQEERRRNPYVEHSGPPSRIFVLTHSKNLQAQYEKIYDWTVMMGKSNYSCNHPYADPNDTVDDCLFQSDRTQCDMYEDCEYTTALRRALSSPKVCFNYALWMSLSKMVNNLDIDLVVCDEAHMLPDLTLNWVGTIFRLDRVLDLGLPMIPRINYDPNPIRGEAGIKEAKGWLLEGMGILGRKLEEMERGTRTKDGDPDKWNDKQKKEYRKLDRAKMRLSFTCQALTVGPEQWYINSGPKAIDSREPGFVAKPLTARFHFPGYYSGPKQVMMMSATIGEPETLMTELGIGDFDYRVIENVWQPETRPVYVVKGCPHMGNTTTKRDPSVFETQADLMAEFIKAYPKDWIGLILVTRKSEAKEIVKRMRARGLGRRVKALPEVSTKEHLREWEYMKGAYKGVIGVTWNFWSGFDGVLEKLLIITKAPFPRLGSPGSYERARTEYDKSFYKLQTALALEQGVGRIRRGVPEHYNLDGEETKAVVILDAGIDMVKKYMSSGFKESIVEWRKESEA